MGEWEKERRGEGEKGRRGERDKEHSDTIPRQWKRQNGRQGVPPYLRLFSLDCS